MKELRYEVLKWAADLLTAHHRDANIGELLLQARLGLTRTDLITGLREPIASKDAEWLRRSVEEHVYKGTPLQYMLGRAPFYGRSFKVNADVLIPRQETEELVWRVGEWAKRYAPDLDHPAVCDIGTGSGAIAVTLGLEHPDWRITAVDLSEKALDVARENADDLGAQIVFCPGDLLCPLIHQPFDILVSNPPYITKQEMGGLDDTVRDYEPHLALYGGNDGLDCYRKIIADMPLIFSGRSVFIAAFEIGATQGNAVADLIRRAFPNQIEALSIEKDISGHDRNIMVVLQTKQG
ncbi:peptide chain release factor N(5)-glutamine methyltransferase [Sporolactobacillus terrae]|uniref:Release factor glutamine methyltransferase n=1 Tax=Sporolactobacillus terrae TaxID=269673 RepID=A0A5K7X2B8_9BACL|nr:peptide chain release factor N(5)-glutamine methyltransferase [Sporolactobacillus terrae]BBO00190.1 release factor glutamine methyltransferase [Sporolactobacillus terrae]